MKTLEVCVNTAGDAVAAAQAGADRIELCSALELGGLTPSAGTLAAVLEQVEVPVLVMIRPRAGGFAYGKFDLQAMCHDAQQAVDSGAAGIVFGMLTDAGEIDQELAQAFVEIAGERESVFHRAFDYVADPTQALATLIEIGCTRVLTSGQQATALAGAATIRALVEQAAAQIEILPGGGIDPDNVSEVLERTGCRQAHLGLGLPGKDHSVAGNAQLTLASVETLANNGYRTIDVERIRLAKQRVSAL